MSRTTVFDFWISLYRLVSFRDVVTWNLDTPLEAGLERARWAAVWTALIGTMTALGKWPSMLVDGLAGLHISLHNEGVILLINVVFIALSIPVTYGFLRLYVLVHHVMVLNVFKCRGQRLRLLNFFSSTLPFVGVLVIGTLLTLAIKLVGILVITAACLYYLVVASRAYNVIFHKRRLGGFGLFLGGTLITWFVLVICGLGIAVALAVIAFFALVILRLFTHTQPHA